MRLDPTDGGDDRSKGVDSDDQSLSRRSFVGGIATTSLLGTLAAQGDSQEERPAWLGAREATVQIRAFGDYDFQYSVEEGDVTGSGAIIDSSGIARTNAHGVAGADTLRVYVGEDQQRSYNAQIRGVTDCSDLAVIEIQGSGFPALSWREDEISPGLEIAAHGFPVGGQRMASTRGIVSRVETEGETEWASVDSVVEHTATIAPGNSGGPLVDTNGTLVGVNDAASFFSQNYAIGSPVARPIVQRLRDGEDVHYLGMNTEAVETEFPMTPDGITRGLHVITVDPGTSAWDAGIRAGDRVLRIRGSRAVFENTPFPTKEFYCDVLRTHGEDAVYPVQVFRPLPGGHQGGMLLEGEINGTPLEVTEAETDQGPTEYESYQEVSDNTGTIQTEVPTAWTEIDGTPTPLGSQLIAAPSIDGLLGTWTTPGVLLLVTDQFGTDTDAALDEAEFFECDIGPREPFETDALSGQIQRLSDCGGTGTQNINIAALPEDDSYMVVALTQAVADRDEQAHSRIIDSLQITGDPTAVNEAEIGLTVPTDQRAVLEALDSVPPGSTVTVSRLARIAGLDPGDEGDIATVRDALRDNPLPIFLPDHRVRDGQGATPPQVAAALRRLENDS